MFRSYRLRQELLRCGISEEATNIYVYIDQVTNRGKKGVEALGRRSLVDMVQFAILRRFDRLQPYIGNIERLYDNQAYRQEWVDKYQGLISRHKDFF